MEKAEKIVGAAYKVLQSAYGFEKGDTVYLIEDDGSNLPWFSYYKHANSHNTCHPIHMEDVGLLDFNSIPAGTKLYRNSDGREIEIIGYCLYQARGESFTPDYLEDNYSFEKPAVKELTMQEIADKFEIDINDLRIKE